MPTSPLPQAPSVQVAISNGWTPGRHGSARRRGTLLAVPLLTTTVPVAVPTIAGATDYAFTGSCSVSTAYSGTPIARSFRARFPRSRSGKHWNLGGYDYTYSVTPDMNWGPHSDERLDITSGYEAGPNPWHSPDDHTSNVNWVAERDWKGATTVDTSVVKLHAWFDIPSRNDPECSVSTAAF